MDAKSSLYRHKSADYFSHVRPEIRDRVTGQGLRVCDVGCGSGALLAALRQQGKIVEAVGLEIDATAASEATRHADRVLVGDLEGIEIPYPPGYFDYVILADVLEHLVDPWRMLARVRPLVRAGGGRVIVSTPNVRHLSVWAPLALLGRWTYAPEGILDATHLRFFTRRTALELVQSCGYRPVEIEGIVYGKRARLLDRLTAGRLRELFAQQYVVVAASSAEEVGAGH